MAWIFHLNLLHCIPVCPEGMNHFSILHMIPKGGVTSRLKSLMHHLRKASAEREIGPISCNDCYKKASFPIQRLVNQKNTQSHLSLFNYVMSLLRIVRVSGNPHGVLGGSTLWYWQGRDQRCTWVHLMLLSIPSISCSELKLHFKPCYLQKPNRQLLFGKAAFLLSIKCMRSHWLLMPSLPEGTAIIENNSVIPCSIFCAYWHWTELINTWVSAITPWLYH